MKDVFISHSSKDIEYAKELYKKLEQDEQLEQIYTQMQTALQTGRFCEAKRTRSGASGHINLMI